jgi:hypothetical protein
MRCISVTTNKTVRSGHYASNSRATTATYPHINEPTDQADSMA